MKHRVRIVLEQLVRNLNAGRHDEVVALYDYPFVLQLEETRTELYTSTEAMAAWQQFRDRFQDLGHARSAIRVVAMEPAAGGRFRVWTELQHHDPEARASGSTSVIFHFRERSRRLSLEGQHVTRKAPGHYGDSAILIVGDR